MSENTHPTSAPGYVPIGTDRGRILQEAYHGMLRIGIAAALAAIDRWETLRRRPNLLTTMVMTTGRDERRPAPS